MIVGEGIVANSGGGSGVNQADVYVWGAISNNTARLLPIVNNMFTLGLNTLTPLKAGNYKFEAYVSACSFWTPRYIDGTTYLVAAYVSTPLTLHINGTQVTTWAASVPSGSANNPYRWATSTTQSLTPNDVVAITLQSGQVTQYSGLIVRITEVE